MFNVCPRCGCYSVEKDVDEERSCAICPHCGYGHPFLRLPLFVLTGASGAGKTSIGLELVERLRGDAVVMETDILWRTEFATPEDDYRSYREMWLRVAKNIGQCGLPVVLVGSAIPEQFEGLSERRYFSEIHYMAAVADDIDLVGRLRARPAWRKCGSDDFIQQMLDFNRWFRETGPHGNPPVVPLDTSTMGIGASVECVALWVRERLFHDLNSAGAGTVKD